MEQGQSFSSWEETVTPLAAKPAAVRAFRKEFKDVVGILGFVLKVESISFRLPS